ncbi:MAG: ASPIC/UnbV domain-containing protein, partial [Candidatus Acidiferrales bacterium]
VNRDEPPSLLRNDLRGNHRWLKVRLIGVKSNCSAIGARVRVHYGRKTQAQAVLSQSSFYSSSDPRLHFGLGAETTADIDVIWPNGSTERLKGIAANQLVTIKEGAGIVRGNGLPRK